MENIVEKAVAFVTVTFLVLMMVAGIKFFWIYLFGSF